MAKKGKSKTQTPQTSNATGVTQNEGERKMAGMTSEQILALLGKSRSKGEYLTYLGQFIESNEGGIAVNEQWPALSQKTANTVKQGFENAKDKKDAPAGSENVKVIKNDDQVFLINLALVEAPEAAAA